MNHPPLDKKLTQVTRPNPGWIGIDLDGTLAHYDGWKGPDHIGHPVPRMVVFVKDLLAQGWEVRILTARCAPQRDPQDIVHAIQAIRAWCVKHIGEELRVTSEKDFSMVWLYDDRCTRVEKNTGVFFDPGHRDMEARMTAEDVPDEEQPGLDPGI